MPIHAGSRKPMKLVVFVGGSGTRMWPMSRAHFPKQFQALVGERSMFQQMLDHLLAGFSPDDLFISTHQRYVELVAQQAPLIARDHIIAEPELRDTTAAVGYAAIRVSQQYPDALMATIWGGDHLIRQRDAFLDTLYLAQRLASEQDLTVQINVRPTFASASLGYVQIGDPTLETYGPNIYTYVRHVEKPDVKTARSFLASVRYLWHTGYRVWNLATLLSLYQQHAPDSYAALMRIHASLGKPDEATLVAKHYQGIIKQAIDYTIFEHLAPAGQVVIAADLGWNDIGTWQVLKDELAVHGRDNVTQGEPLLIDTQGSLVYTPPNKTVAVIGMEDVVIVDTPDALLVMPKERSAEVKHVVEQLKQRGLDAHT